MKYFVPLRDDQLFNERELKRYRLVPYDPDLHLSAVREKLAQRVAQSSAGRARHAGAPA